MLKMGEELGVVELVLVQGVGVEEGGELVLKVKEAQGCAVSDIVGFAIA